MNTDFKINGQSYRFATSAENVKYGSGTVKDALDDIKSFDTSGMSEFGKKLYAADEKEFKRLLEISSEGIWDTGQNRWQGTAIVTDDNGEKVLSLAGTNLQTAAPVEFGGDPFTIKFFLRKGGLPINTTYNVFGAYGQTSSFGVRVVTTANTSVINVNVATGTTSLTATPLALINNYTSTDWRTFEFDYNGAGKLTCKFNDVASKYSGSNPISLTIAREPRRLIFGAFAGYVDDFELNDNGVIKSKLGFE